MGTGELDGSLLSLCLRSEGKKRLSRDGALPWPGGGGNDVVAEGSGDGL